MESLTGAANLSVSAELAIHLADITNTFRTRCSHDYAFKCIGALVWALGCTTHSAPSCALLQPRAHTCACTLKCLVTAKCVLNIKSISLTHSITHSLVHSLTRSPTHSHTLTHLKEKIKRSTLNRLHIHIRALISSLLFLFFAAGDLSLL